MQFRSHGLILAGAVLAAGLVACTKTAAPSTAPSTATSAAATAAAPASAGPAGAIAYEVVTVERPESVDNYHKLYRAAYDICATTRKAMRLPPPPPMTQPPADFIIKRETHASDGKAYLVKQEHFTYVVSADNPAMTCATSLQTSTETQLVRDGKVYNAAVDSDGKRTSTPAEEWILPRERRDQHYTEAKTVKGQAVKCMPMLPDTGELITELCIADLKPGTLTDVTGRPIVLASRVTSVQKLTGAILTEPVSVKVGQPIDKAVFDAAAAP